MNERTIHVVGWERHQHPDAARSTTPPWIKTYTRLLDDPNYLDLTAPQRAVLHGLWLLYARARREIRENTARLTRQLGIRVTSAQLEALNHAGFITFSASKDACLDVEVDREVEVKTIEPSLPAPKPNPTRTQRQPDVIWDAVVEVMGASPGGMERGRWNAAVASLKDSGATPDSIRRAARAYRTMPTFADCAMTPTAIASNYTVLMADGNQNGNGHRRLTGWRLAHGSHGSTLVRDPAGTDQPPRG